MLSNISVSHSPHISEMRSTRGVMIDVIIGLLPAVAAAGFYFHRYALVLVASCVIASVVTEFVCNLIRSKPDPLNSLGDFSAVVTGVILALSLPPAIPWWAAVIGSFFAIAIGKMVFGGLGANIFNPAMVGRTFLTAGFGMLMTTWTVPSTIDSSMPQMSARMPDAVTQATPLAWSKQAVKSKQAEDGSKPLLAKSQTGELSPAAFVNSQMKSLFTGSTGGCLGETSKAALLLGGIYLLVRKTITWHIPAAVVISTFVCSGIGFVADKSSYISPFAHLAAGGLLLCVFFIATDPVTAPLTKRGMWIFGAGIGAMTVVIRIFGEYPEGVMYAVLLMNSVTPLIDRFCKRIPAGGRPNV